VIHALAILNLTNLQEKATKLFTIQKENTQLMTSKKLTEKNYQNQTFGPLEAHAKTSVLRGSKRAYKEAEAPCSLKSCECLTKDKKLRNSFHPISSWKTLKHCYQVAKGGTLQQSSLKWQKEGIIQNGQLSTLPKSYLRIGKGYILSDILEIDVPHKYFLSDDKVKILLEQTQKSK